MKSLVINFFKRIALPAAYIIFCFTFLAYAQGQIAPKQNSLIVEEATPPAAEGPLPIDSIQPLLLSDKAKGQNTANTPPEQPTPSTLSAPTTP
jgi:hypothetical protein